MDDEANLRMAMIVGTAFVVGLAILIFGFGWMSTRGAAGASATVVARINACKSLPVPERTSCISTAPVNGSGAPVLPSNPTTSQYVTYCGQLEAMAGIDDQTYNTCMRAAVDLRHG